MQQSPSELSSVEQRSSSSALVAVATVHVHVARAHSHRVSVDQTRSPCSSTRSRHRIELLRNQLIEYPAPLLVISKLRVRYPTLSFQTGKIRATAHTSTLKLQRIHNNLPHLKDKRPRLSQQTRNSRFKAVQPYCPCVLPAHTEPVQPTRTRHHHANQPKQTKKPGRHAGVKTHQRNQSLTLSRVTRTQQCRWRNPFAEPTKASTLLRSTMHHAKANG